MIAAKEDRSEASGQYALSVSRFYIMLSGADLPQIASNNSSTSTPKEARAIAGGTVGYFGTYTVDVSVVLSIR